jgi:hypothetical protein
MSCPRCAIHGAGSYELARIRILAGILDPDAFGTGP